MKHYKTTIKILLPIAIILGALTFWDIWFMLFYAIEVETNDPSPQDFLKINPMWHFSQLIK